MRTVSVLVEMLLFSFHKMVCSTLHVHFPSVDFLHLDDGQQAILDEGAIQSLMKCLEDQDYGNALNTVNKICALGKQGKSMCYLLTY